MFEPLVLPVIKVRQKIGDFYIASIKAKDLVDISYSDVRRLAEEQRDVEKYLGIQRPVSSRRIKQIKEYIEGGDATFPTAVIVAIDERCIEYEELNEGRGVGQITINSYEAEEGVDEESIPYNKIAKVLDGQHRIAAFMDEDNNWCFDFGEEEEDFEINLSIFVGVDIPDQANIFATVNLAQTKVNRSLVYDLTGLARTRSPYKTCHDIAVALDAEEYSPFFERIKRLGKTTPGRKGETLTQASFVETLVTFISTEPVKDRNLLLEGRRLSKPDPDELIKVPFRTLFIEERDLDIAEIIFNYFCAVRDRWPRSWAETTLTGNLLPRTNAFKALMKYLKEDVYIQVVGQEIGRIPSTEEFRPYLDRVEVNDEDFTTKNFVPGSTGQSVFLKVLRGQLSLSEIVEGD